jgi:hypothetical protein
MVCERLRFNGGGWGYACSRKPTVRRCACGQKAARQCDHELTRRGKRATCDRYICRGCARELRPGVDVCPEHASDVQLALPLE